METKIDKDKLLELIKADADITNVLERLKKDVPSYIKAVVAEECLVNLYLGLPNKNIDVILFMVDEMNAEDKDLLAKMQEKYIITQREFISKRYANRILDSVIRVVGQKIEYDRKVRGDINSVKPTVTVLWGNAINLKEFIPMTIANFERILNKDNGMVNCAAIYVDTDLNIYGTALEDFTVNGEMYPEKMFNEKYCSQVWTYINKGIPLNKKYLKYIASGYKRAESISALAIAKSLKMVSEDEVGDFIDNNAVTPYAIVEYKKRIATKLKF